MSQQGHFPNAAVIRQSLISIIYKLRFLGLSIGAHAERSSWTINQVGALFSVS